MKKEYTWSFILFFAVALVFFFKFALFAQIPFPGDLLVSNYAPWKSYSFLGYNPGAYPTKEQYFDTARQLYPWKALSIESLKHGILPLWNLYNFSGTPLLANIQSAVFYPLNIFYFFLPQDIAWSVLVMLQPILAGFFMYLYTRKIGLSVFSAILASLAYSYSLYMTVFLEYNTIGHIVAFLPLILFAIECGFKRLDKTSLSLFVFGLVFALFAGHLQVFGFLAIFCLLYIFARFFFGQKREQKKSKGALAFLSCAFLLSLGITGVQLFPTLELISQSARVDQSYQFLIENLLIQPNQLIVFFSPDIFGNPATHNYMFSDSYPGNALYIGLFPILFAMMSFVFLKKNYFVRFFVVCSVIILLFIVRTPFSELFYRLKLPFFSTGSPSNAIFLLSFSLSVLAGLGFENLKEQKRNLFRFLAVFALFFGFVWILLAVSHQNIGMRNFFYTTLLFVFFCLVMIFKDRLRITSKIIPLVIIAVATLDLLYFFLKFNPFVPRQFVFPSVDVLSFLEKQKGIRRMWGYGSGAIEANFNAQYRIFSPEGYDPLYIKRYGEFLGASREGKITKNFDNTNRSDAVIAPGFGEENLGANRYRLKILDLLGVGYIVDKAENATQKAYNPARFSLATKPSQYVVYRNNKSLPRAFLVQDYKVFSSSKEFEDTFFSENFDTSSTVLLEEQPWDFSDTQKKTYSQGTVDILSYKSERSIFKTSSSKRGLLFVSDVFYPGWGAYVDGTKVKIYRADYAFRAVVVPSGAHTVEIRYEPKSFQSGLTISVVSVIVFVILLVAVSKKNFYHES